MVYVLNSDGSPLMPCTEAKARHLIESGKAKVVRRTPFRQLTLVERSNTNLMYKEVMEVPSSGRA